MEIKCPQCQQTAQIDDEKVPAQKSAVTCRKCSTVFFIRRQSTYDDQINRNNVKESFTRYIGKIPFWAWAFVAISLTLGIYGSILATYLTKLMMRSNDGSGLYLFLLSPLLLILVVNSCLQLLTSYKLLKSFKHLIPAKSVIISTISNAPIILFFILLVALVLLELLKGFAKHVSP